MLLDGLVHLELLVLFRFGLGSFLVGRSREDVFSQEFYLLGLPPSKHNAFPIHVLGVIAGAAFFGLAIRLCDIDEHLALISIESAVLPLDFLRLHVNGLLEMYSVHILLTGNLTFAPD